MKNFIIYLNNLYINTISVFLCLIFVFTIIENASLQSKIIKGDTPKIKQKKKKNRCCDLGVAFLTGGGKVILDKLCHKKKKSTNFYFRIVNMPLTCTHPVGTILKDGKGRQYRMISHKGLPLCASGKMQTKRNASFEWSFEPLKAFTQFISIIEVADPVTRSMGHWVWNNVNVSHCKVR